MTASIDLQDAIYEHLERLRSGSLSFWGNWFGKPYDNNHKIVGATALDDTIVVSLDQAETLTIEAPRGWSIDDGCLLVREASRVRWQWFYYGRLPGADTLEFEEYRSLDGVLSFTTDFQPGRQVELDAKAPAVQLHPSR
jgi:hypothetical protein